MSLYKKFDVEDLEVQNQNNQDNQVNYGSDDLLPWFVAHETNINFAGRWETKSPLCTSLRGGWMKLKMIETFFAVVISWICLFICLDAKEPKIIRSVYYF